VTVRAPFPWFGGKSRAAPLVWQAFGDVANYVEPFAGSLAVLLARPTPPRVETVNDKDCYLANFWRAVQASPDEVAFWADSPVNEADLHATHRWLVNGEDALARMHKASAAALQALATGDVARAQEALRAGQFEGRPLGAALRERLRKDESYFDAEVAGRWVWGISQWIGSGWCAQPAWEEQEAAGAEKTCGIHTTEYEKRPALDKPGRGVHQFAYRGESLANAVNWEGRANAGRAPRGVNARKVRGVGEPRPAIASAGGGMNGVHAGRVRDLSLSAGWAKRPSIGDGGARGVHTAASSTWQQMPSISGSRGATGRGVTASGSRGTILEWMQALAARLRYVRVCCGDWTRVLTPSVTEAIGTTAVFLDPPYSAAAGRDPSIYAEEDLDVAHAVREWALANGGNPKLRIALCGYEGEHTMPTTWRCVAWKAPGGYAASAGNKANAQRERIWLSPHCLAERQPDLFSFAGATP
jgi:hypothetical protein